MDTGVYLIENVANGRRYVGSAASLKKRWREHRRQLAEGRHHSRFLQRAWNKYGPLFFKFQVVAYCDKANLLFYEQRLIDGLNPDYNVAKVAGSQLGYRHTDETRKKMSIARRRNPSSPRKGMKHSAESKAKISQNRKGKGNCGWTDERRRKISEANKGREVSTEQRAKIAKGLSGHKQSAEQVQKRMSNMPAGHYERVAKAKAKISDETVKVIKARLVAGESQAAIARSTGVAASKISRIHLGLSYGWVTL